MGIGLDAPASIAGHERRLDERGRPQERFELGMDAVRRVHPVLAAEPQDRRPGLLVEMEEHLGRARMRAQHLFHLLYDVGRALIDRQPDL